MVRGRLRDAARDRCPVAVMQLIMGLSQECCIQVLGEVCKALGVWEGKQPGM